MSSKPKISRLDSIQGVSRELASVYRLARRGRLEPSDAAKLAGILTNIKSCLEAGTVETRLGSIEAALGIKPAAVIKLVKP